MKNLAQNTSLADFERQYVCLFAKSGNTSTGIKLKELDDGKASLIPEELEPEIARLKALYNCKEGQFKCGYCGKATDEDKKVKDVVIARQYPGMRKEFDYCSTKCASYNQMAHEG